MAALVCLGELVPGALGAKNQYGKTPAHGAAGSDSVAALVCLDELVPGALEAKGGYGYTPAHQATNRGNVAVGSNPKEHIHTYMGLHQDLVYWGARMKMATRRPTSQQATTAWQR